MEEPRADASESADDPLGRLAKRLLDSSLDDVDLEEPSAPAVEGAVSPLPPPLLRLRDYAVVSRLGRGGMGAVYLAHQRSLPDKQVALKVLPGLYATDPERLARFRNEAVTASRLNHPNVVAVLDMGYENDVHFQVQELVEDGRTLGHLIGEARNARTLPKDWYRTTAELFAKIAEALAAVHAASVLHRDIKPSNILLTPLGEPKVGDFGLAKDLEGVSLTNSGAPGTLNYKSPEQFTKAFGKVDYRSDVFSLGVTMYEALTLTRLFPGDDPREVQPAILEREVEDLRQVRPGVPKDLSTLCRKCLEKRPEKRYQTMAEVAADLRRYLGNEPILAQEPSRWERVWKWSRRNPGVATGIGVGAVALVVISGVALVAMQLANDKAALATEAAAKVSDFNQLAGEVQFQRAVEAELELYPAWPEKVPAMDDWLATTDKLLAKEPGIRTTIASLREKALPVTKEEIEAQIKAHTRYPEYEMLAQRLTSLRRADAIRRGQPTEDVVLSAEQLAYDAKALNSLAWDRVAPKAADRKVWGDEPLGLAAAQSAVARERKNSYLNTLAWALLANGRDAEARQVTGEALAATPAAEREAYEGYQRDIEIAVKQAPEVLLQVESELASLGVELRTWQFGTSQGDEGAGFLHGALTKLLTKFEALKGLKAGVLERRAWAEGIRDLTLHHPNARHTWADVRAAIGNDPKYSWHPVDFREQDITGLVPIGINPKTHLWEFYDLRSAWDGKVDPRTIVIPAHKPDGSIDVTGETGIVFALLTGGTFLMGQQASQPASAHYYVLADDNEEPVQSVTIAPFFLSRYEMTQRQWLRLTKSNPSHLDATSKFFTDWEKHPVEMVSWIDCSTVLSRFGLLLPTEAQWEYACRAGTDTPWSVPWNQIDRVANLADRFAKDNGAHDSWICDIDLNDGYLAHAPVGIFAANAFGLHDMHGNVAEWCQDEFHSYGDAPQEGTGLRLGTPINKSRMMRGAAFGMTAGDARSSHRFSKLPEERYMMYGVRPARAIRP